MTGPLLKIEELSTNFFTRNGVVRAVDGISLEVGRGEIVGLAGESGSGKTVTGFSVLGLIDPPGRIVGGRILFEGEDLRTVPLNELQQLRGRRIAMIFQDPMMTLNPVLRIDTQMIETVLAHENVSRRAARDRALRALEKVSIAAPEERLRQYPHQLSGGMRQRVVIAMALLFSPDLIIADEPTTALDVTVQSQILFEMQALCRDAGTAMIWITHDLSVLAGLADRIAIIYAGRIVEDGPRDAVIHHPRHPYTRGLLDSLPGAGGKRLKAIPGIAPSPLEPPAGCRFHPRCRYADQACGVEPVFDSLPREHGVRCHHPLGPGG